MSSDSDEANEGPQQIAVWESTTRADLRAFRVADLSDSSEEDSDSDSNSDDQQDEEEEDKDQDDGDSQQRIYGANIAQTITANLEKEPSLREALHESWQLGALTHFFGVIRRGFQLSNCVTTDALVEWVLFPAGRVAAAPQSPSALNQVMWRLLHRRPAVKLGVKKCIHNYPVGWLKILERTVDAFSMYTWPVNPLSFGVSFFELHWKDRLNMLYAVVHWLADTDPVMQHKFTTSEINLRALPIGFDHEGNVYWYFGQAQDAYVFLHVPGRYVERGNADAARRTSSHVKIYDPRVLEAAKREQQKAQGESKTTPFAPNATGTGEEEDEEEEGDRDVLEWSESDEEYEIFLAEQQQCFDEAKQEQEQQSTAAAAVGSVPSSSSSSSSSSSAAAAAAAGDGNVGLAALGLDASAMLTGKRKRKATKVFSFNANKKPSRSRSYPSFSLSYLLQRTGWNVACSSLPEMRALYLALQKTGDEDQKRLAEQLRVSIYPAVVDAVDQAEKTRMRLINRELKREARRLTSASIKERPKSRRVQALEDRKREEEEARMQLEQQELEKQFRLQQEQEARMEAAAEQQQQQQQQNVSPRKQERAHGL